MRPVICLLGLLWCVLIGGPAFAQGEALDGTLHSFSALPNPHLQTKFDLTSVDFTKEIPAGYLVGPGDVLVINLGNIAQDQDQQVVSPQGDIFVPVIGKVKVSGETIPDLTERISTAMEPYFRNYHLTITVGRVRKIEVQFSGMVSTPGTYLAYGGTSLSHFMQIVSQRFTEEPLNTAVPPGEFASRTNNRFRALLPEGSFRRVTVFRNGERFRVVDLAALMVFGDYSKDLILEQGDRIHVPALDKYVVFDESVPFSGKIELLPGDTLPQLMKMMGGPENFTLEDTVEIQTGRYPTTAFYTVRIQDSVIVGPTKDMAPIPGTKGGEKGQEMLRTHYSEEATADRIAALPTAYQPGMQLALTGGELIRMTRANDVIYLVGGWLRPGGYGYRADWTVLDYIGQSGGFHPGAQEGEARWIRRGLAGQAPSVEYVSLKGVMLGVSPLPELQPGDMLYVPSKNSQWPGPALLGTLLNFGTQLRLFN